MHENGGGGLIHQVLAHPTGPALGSRVKIWKHDPGLAKGHSHLSNLILTDPEKLCFHVSVQVGGQHKKFSCQDQLLDWSSPGPGIILVDTETGILPFKHKGAKRWGMFSDHCRQPRPLNTQVPLRLSLHLLKSYSLFAPWISLLA